MPRMKLQQAVAAGIFTGIVVATVSAGSQGQPTGSMAGRVVDAVTRQPIEGALVSRLPASGGAVDTVRTDREGRFVLHQVPAGEWSVGATAPGHQGTAAGGRTMIAVATGALVSDITVALRPFGVIAGVVRQSSGEPVVGVTVQSFRKTAHGRYVQAARTATDDQGQYRLSAQPAGRYVIFVPSTVAPVPGGSFLFPTTFSPGMPNLISAQEITLTPGQVRLDADVYLTPERGLRVRGTLVGDEVSNVSGSMVTLRREGEASVQNLDVDRARIDAAGRFEFAAVPPGRYTVSLLKTTQAPDPVRATWVAEHQIVVTEGSVSDVAVPVIRGVRVSGRAVFDGSAPRPVHAPQDRFELVMQSAGNVGMGLLNTQIRDDDTFESPEIPPGSFYLFAAVPAPWQMRSAMFEGRDISDLPVTVGRDPIQGVVVTYTDRPPVLVGTVFNAAGSAHSGARVVAFPTDRMLWADTRTNRRLQIVTADRNSGFRFTRLPAGEYHVASIDPEDADDWNDPASLASLANAAVRVTLIEGGTTTASLRAANDDVDVDQTDRVSGPFVPELEEFPQTVVTGTVRAGRSDGNGVAGVLVRLTRLSDGASRTDYTDPAGRYTFAAIDAGRYRLTATKPAHLPAEFGAPWPGVTGHELVMTDGMTSEPDLVIHRAGVITGVVRDYRGRPQAAASVQVVRVARVGNTLQALRQAGEMAAMFTDDRGAYRVYDLPPGDYVVAALPEQLTALSAGKATAADGPDAAVMSQAPVFHPDARSLDEARVIRVGVGEEVAGIDVAMSLNRAGGISGAIVMPDGSAPAGSISLSINGERSRGPVVAAPGGRIQIAAWPAGSYDLRARATIANRRLWASSRLQHDGRDQRVQLTLQPAPVLTARVGAAASARLPSAGLQLVLTPIFEEGRTQPVPAAVNGSGDARIDGVFPGQYFVSMTGLPAGWALQAVTVGGNDALGRPLTIEESSEPIELQVSLTDRPSRIQGRVMSDTQLPSPVHVLVFPHAEDRWFLDSPAIRVVSADARGQFLFEGLVPGDYYLIAVDGGPPSSFSDPAVLRNLVPLSASIVVAEGAHVQQDLAYSHRNAFIGSTRDARRAGIKPAARATSASTTSADVKTTGSCPVTSKSCDSAPRPIAMARPIPIAPPMAAMIIT